MVFGREPAVFYTMVAAVLNLLSATVLHFSIEQQGTINAVIVFAGGLVVALRVSLEKALALLSGVVQAVIACALAFGLALTPDVQSSVMVAVGAIVAFVVRDRVVAPKAPDGSDVPAVSTV